MSVTGAIIGFLAARLMSSSRAGEMAVLKEKIKEYEEVSRRAEELTGRNEELKSRISELSTKEDMISSRNRDLGEELERLRETNLQLHRELSEKKSNIDHLQEKLESQKADLEKLNERFTKEFENLAGKILKDNSEYFQKNSSDRLDTLLRPFKEEIKEFRGRIDKTREDQMKENISLKEQIHNLMGLNQQMSEEAKNLTRALKGESQTRGAWGEMILETVLESSGLREGIQYELQKSMKNEEGQLLRPDVVVKLPGNKNIVVDSKLSLVDYEQFINAQEEKDREIFRKKHVESLKRHIKDLSSKNYAKLYDIASPDFTLMFIPIDPAFYAAVESDQGIYQEALQKNIVIVTPATLLATLRIVNDIWRLEDRNKNAEVIAELGGKLYDKLAAFMDDMQEIEKGIKKSGESYEKAMKKLTSGRGNALGIAEKMKQLGVSASKSISVDTVTNDADDDSLF